MALADESFWKSGPVDLLIGADLYPSILSEDVPHRLLGGLVAQSTKLGWIVTGPVPQVSCFSTTVRVAQESDPYPKSLVSRPRYIGHRRASSITHFSVSGAQITTFKRLSARVTDARSYLGRTDRKVPEIRDSVHHGTGHYSSSCEPNMPSPQTRKTKP